MSASYYASLAEALADRSHAWLTPFWPFMYPGRNPERQPFCERMTCYFPTCAHQVNYYRCHNRINIGRREYYCSRAHPPCAFVQDDEHDDCDTTLPSRNVPCILAPTYYIIIHEVLCPKCVSSGEVAPESVTMEEVNRLWWYEGQVAETVEKFQEFVRMAGRDDLADTDPDMLFLKPEWADRRVERRRG